MSRERNEEKKGLSPTQRKACVVLALCALAVVMSILAAWVLPTKLGLFAGGKDSYDPDAYPLDTTLDSILPQSAADDAYITASVFAGDQYAVTLQKDTRITLNQFVGQEGLQISKALSTSCVNFASDASSYTIPQAIPKMKARRVFVVLGANDVDGSVSVDSFIADYKQFLQSIRSAYAYCDIIAVGIPPVTEDSTNAAETQTRIDQFNQAIAAASSDLGFKYLNTAEALKNTRGYGEGTYFESNGFSTSGARALLEYAKSHACNTMDSRPDTSDIPQRASASAGSNTPVPTSTPTKFTASYEVEDSAKGTLTGNGQTGVSSVEIQADSGTSVNVTAVAAEGFVFYKWSDGVTTATRYDNITKDISVKAMFNDARVELTLDKGDIVDEAHGHALHAACGQAPAHLAPQEGAELVTHQTVQHTAGLLGVEQIFVDGAGVGHALLHALFGDLVKGDAVGGVGVQPQDVGQMPADGFAFAVRVGRQQNAVGVLGLAFEFLDELFLAFDADVLGRIAVLHINAQLGSRQVPDMAHAGGDLIVIAQIFANGLRLCRRLHDH